MRMKRLPVILALREGATFATRIANALRDAIVAGRIAPGDPLPSSRDLAEQFGVARNTVLSAIALLADSDLIETRPGVGTFVKSRAVADATHRQADWDLVSLTAWAQNLPDEANVVEVSGASLDLRPGVPDLRAIPFDDWRRSAVRKLKTLRVQIGSYGAPEGDRDLRVEIAQYAARSRSVVCRAEDVIVTSGAQQAFDLIARILVRPGMKVAIEEPGYQPAARAFAAGGAELCLVPVDESGLDVGRVPDDAAMVYVTPSHQYPLGVTMSDARRRALLDWASQRKALIVEDDYDSEYRYTKSALPALQASDSTNRVIYVGTFSKNLMPGIRLGYLIVPEALRTVFITGKWLVDRHSDNVSQSVLAEFMSSGVFARHIVRMQKIYAERHATLVQHRDALSRRGAVLLETDAGLHACLVLPPGRSETALIADAARLGVGLYGLRKTFTAQPTLSGLILGFGNLETRHLQTAMGRLVELLG